MAEPGCGREAAAAAHRCCCPAPAPRLCRAVVARVGAEEEAAGLEAAGPSHHQARHQAHEVGLLLLSPLFLWVFLEIRSLPCRLFILILA